MSRFNVRTVAPPTIPVAPLILNKAPSAYAALKHGHIAPAPVVTHVEEAPAKKKGRPSKDEIRKRRLELASAGIAALVSAKPTRAKISEYFENRIMELDEEKR